MYGEKFPACFSQKSSFCKKKTFYKKVKGLRKCAVQPITRDPGLQSPYQQQAGFLAYRSSYEAAFPVSQ